MIAKKALEFFMLPRARAVLLGEMLMRPKKGSFLMHFSRGFEWA